jgi:hypothetical protein
MLVITNVKVLKILVLLKKLIISQLINLVLMSSLHILTNVTILIS